LDLIHAGHKDALLNILLHNGFLFRLVPC